MPPTPAPLLPGLVVAGVPKAATSSLWSYLAQHPQIAASAVKETRYWHPLRYPGGQLAPVSTYHEQWAGTDPAALRMEATPGYFYGGRTLATALEQGCPGVRIVISLREPASRLQSGLQYHKSRMEMPAEMTLREYVESCRAQSHEELWDKPFNRRFGVAAGLYADLLPQWVEVFGERLRVVFFDDVIADPRLVVGEICAWLGLDTDPVDELPLQPKNVSYAPRNAGLQRAAVRVNEVSKRFLARHPEVKAPLLAAYRRINAAPSAREVDHDEVALLAEMKQWYAEQNAGLREQLTGDRVIGRIPGWVS